MSRREPNLHPEWYTTGPPWGQGRTGTLTSRRRGAGRTDGSDGQQDDAFKAPARSGPQAGLLSRADNAWPADVNNDTFSDATDLTAFAGHFGLPVGPSPAMTSVRARLTRSSMWSGTSCDWPASSGRVAA